MTITGSNTTNFGFQKLGSNDDAGYSTINEVVDGIDTILNASDRLIKASQTPTASYVITGDGSDWVRGLVVTNSITDLAVTTGKINDLAITTGKIADTAVTNAKIADTTITQAKLTSGGASSGQVLTAVNGAAPTWQAASIGTTNLADSSVTLEKIAAAVQATLVPTGTVSAFAGSSAPTGYLLCDGTSGYSTTTYAALFAVIGYTYGGSGGSFSVPNLKGRTIIGVGVGSEITGTLGTVQGVKEVTLTASQSGIPAHTHPDGTTSNHNSGQLSAAPFAGGGTIALTSYSITGYDSSYSNHTHNFSISANTAAAAASAHTNIQPSMPLNYIIKV